MILQKLYSGLKYNCSGPFEEAAEASRGMAVKIQDAGNSGGKGLTKEKIKQMGLEKDLGNLSGRACSSKT